MYRNAGPRSQAGTPGQGGKPASSFASNNPFAALATGKPRAQPQLAPLPTRQAGPDAVWVSNAAASTTGVPVAQARTAAASAASTAPVTANPSSTRTQASRGVHAQYKALEKQADQKSEAGDFQRASIVRKQAVQLRDFQASRFQDNDAGHVQRRDDQEHKSELEASRSKSHLVIIPSREALKAVKAAKVAARKTAAEEPK